MAGRKKVKRADTSSLGMLFERLQNLVEYLDEMRGIVFNVFLGGCYLLPSAMWIFVAKRGFG